MPLDFKKVFPSDFEKIVPLLNKFSRGGFSGNDKRELFKLHWNSGVDFCGIQVVDGENPIAYLGLIFSQRCIRGQKQIFCNLTNLVVDERYRGQKLTHRIVQYLQSLGDFSLTAITPIPSLYSMYKSNGFVELNDYRTVFWKNSFKKTTNGELLTEQSQIRKNVAGSSLDIYEDHRQFNCQMAVFKKGNQAAFIVMKKLSGQRRKFITNRLINYFDWACRKILKADMLSSPMWCLEVHYCDNYEFLLQNMGDFVVLCHSKYGAPAISIRQDLCDKFPSAYFLKNRFFHSRQMFYSKSVASEDYDTLYSEIFVLDM
jgi:hypothetical protein